jgi:hypothetical protein
VTLADAAPYVLYYVSADWPTTFGTWSVYREEYVTPDAPEPIDRSQTHISTHPSEEAAYAEARRLQVATALYDPENQEA